MARPELSILIPTHARRAMLASLLEQLLDMPGPSREVIVIDDASSDGTAEMLRGFPDVRSLRNDRPQGFDSLPEAVALARGAIIVQLDDDAVPAPGTLERVTTHFRQRGPRLGLVALPFKEPHSGRLSYTPYFPKDAPGKTYLPTRGFHAGAVAARREACLEVPLSPPGYTMYGTEVPTVIELLSRGWEADYLPGAPVLHYWKARGTRAVSPRAAYYPLRNDLVTIWRYYRGGRRFEMAVGRYLSGFFHLLAAGRPGDLFKASADARDLLERLGERDVPQEVLDRVYPAFDGLTLTTLLSETTLRRLGWFVGLVPIDQTA